MRGSGFLPTDALKCRLIDARTLVSKIVDARYVRDARLCATPEHPPTPSPIPSSSARVVGAHRARRVRRVHVRDVRRAHGQREHVPVARGPARGEHRGVVRRGVDRTVGVAQVAGRGFRRLRQVARRRDVRRRRVRYFDAYSADDFVSGGASRDGDSARVDPAGVMKHVSVSNDGGVSWSADAHGRDAVPVLTSTSRPRRRTANGDGTSRRPTAPSSAASTPRRALGARRRERHEPR